MNDIKKQISPLMENGKRRNTALALMLGTCLLFPQGASAAAENCPLTGAERQSVKWDPGHYVIIQGKNVPQKQAKFIQAYKNVPTMIGMQRSYYWSQLESRKGVYDFSMIDEDIRKMSAAGKKVAALIEIKYEISPTQSSLPDYILNQAPAKISTKGGQLTVPPYFIQGKPNDGAFNHGHSANLGHPGTQAAFINLLDALSKRYDRNPAFSSLSFNETALGAPVNAAQHDAAMKGIMAAERHASCTFKHTPVFQGLNFPRAYLADFTANMKAYGVGLSGPDVFTDSLKDPLNALGFRGKDSKTRDPGVYHYYPEMSRIVPIGAQVHYENFFYLTHDDMMPPPGKPHKLSAAEALDRIYDFSVQNLKPNYMFWQVFNEEYEVLERRLKSEAGLPLRTACPPVYEGKCNAPLPAVKPPAKKPAGAR